MSAAPDSRIAFLLAEAGIRQLYARYADAVWRQDRSAFLDCFTDDATWKIAGQTLVGHEAIGAFFEASTSLSHKVMFWSGIPVLDVGEGTATGRVQVTELIKRADGSALRTLAIYYERYREEEGAWRLNWHHFNMYYLGPPDLSGSYHGCMEYGPPPGLPPDDAPTIITTRRQE